MDNAKLEILLAKLRELESELVAEIQKKEHEFGYVVRGKKVSFTKLIARQNRKLGKKLSRYLREAKIFNLLSAPVIWSCLFPALILDLFISFYQFVCFPVYGIPKVKRVDYIVMDRHKLGYLNFIEKLNCVYCEYVNGLMAYAMEIAGRTEQHWCPIKHALKMRIVHSRYHKFFDYGDAEQYRARLAEVARDFDDLKKK